MAEIVESKWKTGSNPPAQNNIPQEEGFDFKQFAKQQGAMALDAVGSLGMTAIGNPLKQMTGSDWGFGSTDMSNEAVNAKVSNPNEYADAASNAMVGIMGGKAIGMGVNKLAKTLNKPAAKYFKNEVRDLELAKSKKTYKANQSNRNKITIDNYYKNNEPDVGRYVKNIEKVEDEAFALGFNKKHLNELTSKMESKLKIAEGADRIPKKGLQNMNKKLDKMEVDSYGKIKETENTLKRLQTTESAKLRNLEKQMKEAKKAGNIKKFNVLLDKYLDAME